jgi:hypothetical protein
VGRSLKDATKNPNGFGYGGIRAAASQYKKIEKELDYI